MVPSFGRVPYARLPYRGDFVCHGRLTEIRFEGLVGLTPPLSYSLPPRTGPVFSCAVSVYRASVAAGKPRPRARVPACYSLTGWESLEGAA